ncbi:MAG: adenylate kinase [Planctomycetia bacterium]|nr:adenylate kinase [Planctomycetia bacterium]
MRVILLGPPGCGKGTQAKLLSKRLGLEHIGTGDLLRSAIRQGTVVGMKARTAVESGQLVSDEVVNEIVAERFARIDRPQRFAMDGYPRTVMQARSFDAVLRVYALPLDAVVLFKLEDEHIIARLSGRWSCPSPGCKATYHNASYPPRQHGFCDDCGTNLVQREDDRESTVRARLVVYHRDTAELIPYYKGMGLLRDIDGQGEIETIFQQTKKVLESC